MARILLTGFEPDGDFNFALKLSYLGHQVRTQASSNIDFSGCDAVFASSEDVRWPRLFDQMRRQNAIRPLVLVSRVATDEGWINALEAGATDYCSFDVEPAHLRFIVENTRSMKVAAASAA